MKKGRKSCGRERAGAGKERNPKWAKEHLYLEVQLLLGQHGSDNELERDKCIIFNTYTRQRKLP